MYATRPLPFPAKSTLIRRITISTAVIYCPLKGKIHTHTSRPCLKIGTVSNGKEFFAREGDLTRQYFVYCKENQRSMAEKEPPFGHIDFFQTWPKAAAAVSGPSVHMDVKADLDIQRFQG